MVELGYRFPNSLNSKSHLRGKAFAYTVEQNVVATVNLDCKLDLKEIALKARNAEYNPKRFAAVIMRIREPKATALIFSSGKMVCTGSKSETDARLAARKFARILQKLEMEVTFKEFKVQNMVGSCDVRFPIRLEGLAATHSHFCSYEPELFPGLIYRMIDPKVVLLIFVSGKVVLTGWFLKNNYAVKKLYSCVLIIFITLCIQVLRKERIYIAPLKTYIPSCNNSKRGKECLLPLQQLLQLWPHLQPMEMLLVHQHLLLLVLLLLQFLHLEHQLHRCDQRLFFLLLRQTLICAKMTKKLAKKYM